MIVAQKVIFKFFKHPAQFPFRQVIVLVHKCDCFAQVVFQIGYKGVLRLYVHVVAGIGQMDGLVPVLGLSQPEKGLSEFGADIQHRILLRVFRYQYSLPLRIVAVRPFAVFSRYEIHGIISAVFYLGIKRIQRVFFPALLIQRLRIFTCPTIIIPQIS